MPPPKVYEFVLDLVQIAQIGLFAIGICILLLLRKNFHKNKYGFTFIVLLLISLLNSYLLKYISPFLPNLLPLYILIAGPTLLFHIREYQTVGNSSGIFYRKHLYISIVLALIGLLIVHRKFEILFTVFIALHFGYYLSESVNALSKKRVLTLRDSKTPVSILKKRWKLDFYILIAIFSVYITAIIESFFTEIRMLYRFTYIVMLLTILSLLSWLLVDRVRYLYEYHRENIRLKSDRYKNSSLSKEDSLQLAIRLQELMRAQKLYLDNEIHLKAVASKLKVHPKLLSQAINENLEANFFEYINTLRIHTAQSMLSDPYYKEYRIYEVMYEVGFNSRSSFNTAFKKQVGMTAKQFKEKHFPS